MTEAKVADRVQSSDRAVGEQIESPFGRPERQDPNQIKTADQLSSSFNDAIKALDAGQKGAGEKMFGTFSADLEKSLADAYTKGGMAKMDQEILNIDGKIEGKGTGLLKKQHADLVTISAVRPVNPAVAEILDQAAPTSGRFEKVTDAEGKKFWVERLGSTHIDLRKLDQTQQATNNFELGGKKISEIGKEVGAELKNDLSKFNGEGVSESFMGKIGHMVRDAKQATPELQKSINEALKGSGLSIALQYTDKLPSSLHRTDTVHQSIVEVSQQNKVIARETQRRDTVRSAGKAAPTNDPGDFGIVRGK